MRAILSIAITTAATIGLAVAIVGIYLSILRLIEMGLCQ